MGYSLGLVARDRDFSVFQGLYSGSNNFVNLCEYLLGLLKPFCPTLVGLFINSNSSIYTKYANMHIVFIWNFYMLKLNIEIFICNELKLEISNEF